MHKGFISIITSLVIMGIGLALGYVYTQKLQNNLNENVVSVSQKVDKLGGSVVGIQYGGLGTSTVGWGGLIRYTSGRMATTSLTDTDVPDNITVTGITSLSLSNLSSASTTLNGNTVINNTSTFTAIPTLPASDPTTDNQATRKSYVDSRDLYKTYLIPSNVLQLSADTERAESGITYVVEKDVYVRTGGSVILSYDIKVVPDADGTVGFGIVMNDAACSGGDVNYTTYTTVTSTTSVEPGDKIQACLKGDGSRAVYIQNFRLYYTVVSTSTFSTVTTD